MLFARTCSDSEKFLKLLSILVVVVIMLYCFCCCCCCCYSCCCCWWWCWCCCCCGVVFLLLVLLCRCCFAFFAFLLLSLCLFLLLFLFLWLHRVNSYLSQYPRTEAVTILGSLLCYPNAFPNMKIYQIGCPTLNDQPSVLHCREIKVRSR